ncbi:hypothetical protein CMI47_19200 [Candidatus Pacearchaeota archaeon]|nr:hypothetical protein [Candidatus Pacearchaeota archaeon]|tara:strand:+ start:11071 stop:11352 length:282 start_codon:yes stop_codon:yes gene_type:complete
MGKQEDIILKRINSIRSMQLMQLKDKVSSLRDGVDRLSDKIEQDGLNGFYSSNSDILRYSQEVWRASQYLQTLMDIEHELIIKSRHKKTRKKK